MNNSTNGKQANPSGNLNELMARLTNSSNNQFNFSNVPPSLPLHLLQQNRNTSSNDVRLASPSGVPNVVISRAIPNMNNIGNTMNEMVNSGVNNHLSIESDNGSNRNTNKNKNSSNHNGDLNMSNSNSNSNRQNSNKNSNKNGLKIDEVCRE